MGLLQKLQANFTAMERERLAAVAPAPATTPRTVARVATVAVASAPKPNPDRATWPHSVAMNTGEIDRMLQRLALFADRGLTVPEAEAIADKLVTRDREGDRRGSCAECRRLAGYGATGWRCTDRTPGNELAGARLARDWLVQLHHCPGQTLPMP